MMKRTAVMAAFIIASSRSSSPQQEGQSPQQQQQHESACRAVLTYFTKQQQRQARGAGGGGGATASGGKSGLQSQRMRGLERWLSVSGREECRDGLLRSALTLAAMNGDADGVEVLLSYGYDVNGRDVNQLTPLHYASWKGHSEVVSRLLSAGGDPALMDDFGTTPLHKAAAFGHLVVMQQLLRTGRLPVDTRTGPITAPPHYEAVSMRQAALHVALRPSSPLSLEERRALVATLLEFGASPAVTDAEGRTALHYAVALGDPLMVWWLRSAQGGSQAARVADDIKGQTPLQALTWRNCYLLPLLLVGGMTTTTPGE